MDTVKGIWIGESAGKEIRVTIEAVQFGREYVFQFKMTRDALRRDYFFAWSIVWSLPTRCIGPILNIWGSEQGPDISASGRGHL
jgi:hypothetical protein